MEKTTIAVIFEQMPKKVVGPQGNNYYLTIEADELSNGVRVFYKASYSEERVAERWFHVEEEQPEFKIEEMKEILQLGGFRVLNLNRQEEKPNSGGTISLQSGE